MKLALAILVLALAGCDLPHGPQREVEAAPAYLNGQQSPCFDAQGHPWVRSGSRDGREVWMPMTGADMAEFMGVN
jgi:hypothetical protein